MMDENTRALEEIRTIRRMIEDSGSYTGRIWIFFLIWGAALLTASVVSQLLAQAARWSAIWPTWLLLCVAAAFLSFLAGGRDARTARRVTFLDRAIGTTWTGLTITILLLMAVSALGGPPLAAAIPFLVGASHFTMAGLLRARVWLVGAALWWIGGLCMLARPDLVFVIMASLMAVLYVLPGAYGWWSSRTARLADG
jgi:hypothetical protein